MVYEENENFRLETREAKALEEDFDVRVLICFRGFRETREILFEWGEGGDRCGIG